MHRVVALLVLVALSISVEARPYDIVPNWISGWAVPQQGQKSASLNGATPGGREEAAVTVADGSVYLYGGYALASPVDNGQVAMGDLWQYINGAWTWKHGVRDPLDSNYYTNADQFNSSVSPGPRVGAYLFPLLADVLILFSGQPPSPHDPLSLAPPLSDCWIWLGSWVQTSSSAIPTGRVGASTTQDASGNFWMLGGYYTNPQDVMLELWVYELQNQAWNLTWKATSNLPIYPTNPGETSSPNGIPQPQLRLGASIFVLNGTMWYYGGKSTANAELWSFSNGNWTYWATFSHDPSYPSVGNTCGGCSPGSRYHALYFAQGSTLYVYGGYILDASGNENLVDDQWAYDTVQKTWLFVGGSKSQQLPPFTNGYTHKPQFGCEVDCWVYGGINLQHTFSNELQKVNNQSTTEISPYTANVSPVFPLSAGYSDLSPRAPSMKGGAMVVVNESLFVGFGESGMPAALSNDMWQFYKNTNTWQYVIVTVAPPARQYGTVWTDQTNIWVFGGEDAQGIVLNDLWKFDIAKRSWDQVSATNPWPAARSQAQADFDGKDLWMFGGWGLSDQLSDLWKFDTNMVQWQAVYVPTSPDVSNSTNSTGPSNSSSNYAQPVGRAGGMACTNGEGLWVYGGMSNSAEFLSEFWYFDFLSQMWTLLSNGSHSPVYPQEGNTSDLASPGARAFGSMIYFDGAVILLGGESNLFANDIWVYTNSSWYWLYGAFNNTPYSFIYPNSDINTVIPARASFGYALDGSYLWFYGGEGRPDPAFSSNILSMGDLWSLQIGKVTMSKSKIAFEWKKGIPKNTDAVPQQTTPFPGVRASASLCDSGNGDMWLYGGISVDSNQGGGTALTGGLAMADLWRVSKDGKNFTLEYGFYNAYRYTPDNVGETVDGATPGSRAGAIIWAEGDDVWLFGGLALWGSAEQDLWKFDSKNKSWYWMGATAGFPSDLYLYAHTFDQNGDFWIFGGGHAEFPYQINATQSDLWQFSRATHTWTQHASAGNSTPEILGAALWVDAGAACAWVYGGAQGSGGVVGAQMWKFDLTNGNWTMVGGSLNFTLPKYSEELNSPCPTCTPGSRVAVTANWLSGTDLYLFGGTDTDASATSHEAIVPYTPKFSDLWRYSLDTATWFWMGGDKGPQVATQSFGSSPMPLSSPAFYVDQANNLVSFFGGMDSNNTMRDEFMQLNVQTQSWTITPGRSNTPLYPDYASASQRVSAAPGATAFGSMNFANGEFFLQGGSEGPSAWKLDPTTLSWTYLGSPQNTSQFPPSISQTTWTLGGKMYFFGGGFEYVQYLDGEFYCNKYSGIFYSLDLATGDYTYLGGSLNGPGNYYTSDPQPGARIGASGWVIENDLWLFGGFGIGDSSYPYQGYLNDLWRYNVIDKKWYFINGDPTSLVRTAQGPSGRKNAAVANTKTHVWLYGGTFGFETYASDLWEYSTQSNTWTLLADQPFKYPEQPGAGSPTYSPGSMTQASLAYFNGSVFLFGGSNPYTYSLSFVNDLWEYDLAEKSWYWHAGNQNNYLSSLPDTVPPAQPADALPSPRTAQAYAQDNAGMWFYGGFASAFFIGVPQKGAQGLSMVPVADLWYISIDKNVNVPPDNGTYLSTIATTVTMATYFSTTQGYPLTLGPPTPSPSSGPFPSTSFPSSGPFPSSSYPSSGPTLDPTTDPSQTTQGFQTTQPQYSNGQTTQGTHVNQGERISVTSSFLCIFLLFAILGL